MSPEDEWPNKRIDDLATEVPLVASLVPHVARHDVKIEALENGQQETNRRLGRFEDKLDASSGRMTPKQWAATVGPVLIAIIGAVGLVLAKGGP